MQHSHCIVDMNAHEQRQRSPLSLDDTFEELTLKDAKVTQQSVRVFQSPEPDFGPGKRHLAPSPPHNLLCSQPIDDKKRIIQQKLKSPSRKPAEKIKSRRFCVACLQAADRHKLYRCSGSCSQDRQRGCNFTIYCSRHCQKRDWMQHRIICQNV